MRMELELGACEEEKTWRPVCKEEMESMRMWVGEWGGLDHRG